MVPTPTRDPTSTGQILRPRPLRLYPRVMSEERTLFTITEAATQLGISPETLRTAARVGTLAVERINPRLNMVTPAAIEAYRRDHLGREGRPKGAKNKPKTVTAGGSPPAGGTKAMKTARPAAPREDRDHAAAAHDARDGGTRRPPVSEGEGTDGP